MNKVLQLFLPQAQLSLAATKENKINRSAH